MSLSPEGVLQSKPTYQRGTQQRVQSSFALWGINPLMGVGYASVETDRQFNSTFMP